ncbi:MAG: DUF4230 domain-containing protein [Dokdonella sp.]
MVAVYAANIAFVVCAVNRKGVRRAPRRGRSVGQEVVAEDIQVTGKKIAIHLPPSRIVDSYIDDKLSRVESRNTGWFIAHRSDLESRARQKALSNLMTAAKAQGIDHEAEVRAKTLIGQFFKGMGYEVEYL